MIILVNISQKKCIFCLIIVINHKSENLPGELLVQID